jgi:hypothetical protein
VISSGELTVIFACREGEFEKAHTDFFEAFKNYDESGSPRRTTCLKYLVLANMLMKSGINPFDSQVRALHSCQTAFQRPKHCLTFA